PIPDIKIRVPRIGAGKGSPLNPPAQNTSASPEVVGPGWRNPGGRTPIISLSIREGGRGSGYSTKTGRLDIDGVPHIYVSTYQDNSKELSVVLRTSLPAAQLEPQIRHEIQSIDAVLPVFNVSSMNDILDRS